METYLSKLSNFVALLVSLFCLLSCMALFSYIFFTVLMFTMCWILFFTF